MTKQHVQFVLKTGLCFGLLCAGAAAAPGAPAGNLLRETETGALLPSFALAAAPE